MKKIMLWIMTGIMLVSLSACGNQPHSGETASAGSSTDLQNMVKEHGETYWKQVSSVTTVKTNTGAELDFSGKTITNYLADGIISAYKFDGYTTTFSTGTYKTDEKGRITHMRIDDQGEIQEIKKSYNEDEAKEPWDWTVSAETYTKYSDGEETYDTEKTNLFGLTNEGSYKTGTDSIRTETTYEIAEQDEDQRITKLSCIQTGHVSEGEGTSQTDLLTVFCDENGKVTRAEVENTDKGEYAEYKYDENENLISSIVRTDSSKNEVKLFNTYDAYGNCVHTKTVTSLGQYVSISETVNTYRQYYADGTPVQTPDGNVRLKEGYCIPEFSLVKYCFDYEQNENGTVLILSDEDDSIYGAGTFSGDAQGNVKETDIVYCSLGDTEAGAGGHLTESYDADHKYRGTEGYSLSEDGEKKSLGNIKYNEYGLLEETSSEGKAITYSYEEESRDDAGKPARLSVSGGSGDQQGPIGTAVLTWTDSGKLRQAVFEDMAETADSFYENGDTIWFGYDDEGNCLVQVQYDSQKNVESFYQWNYVPYENNAPSPAYSSYERKQVKDIEKTGFDTQEELIDAYMEAAETEDFDRISSMTIYPGDLEMVIADEKELADAMTEMGDVILPDCFEMCTAEEYVMYQYNLKEKGEILGYNDMVAAYELMGDTTYFGKELQWALAEDIQYEEWGPLNGCSVIIGLADHSSIEQTNMRMELVMVSDLEGKWHLIGLSWYGDLDEYLDGSEIGGD